MASTGASRGEIAELLSMSEGNVGFHLRKHSVVCPAHGKQWCGSMSGGCTKCSFEGVRKTAREALAKTHLEKVGAGVERLCKHCGTLRLRIAFRGTRCKTCYYKHKYARLRSSPKQQADLRASTAKLLQKVRESPELKATRNKQRMTRVRARLQDGSPFKLRRVFSTTVWQALRKRNSGKRGLSWEKLVGYTITDLRAHLESLFKPGMTWLNYGKWHVDHKKPQVLFEFDSADHPEFRACWALSNLQPLWALDNLRKGDSYAPEFLDAA